MPSGKVNEVCGRCGFERRKTVRKCVVCTSSRCKGAARKDLAVEETELQEARALACGALEQGKEQQGWRQVKGDELKIPFMHQH